MPGMATVRPATSGVHAKRCTRDFARGSTMIVLAAAGIVFSSLTIEMNASELRWSFGPGFWTCRLPLDEIETVTIVRNRWWTVLQRIPASHRKRAGRGR